RYTSGATATPTTGLSKNLPTTQMFP
ncbi:uncharacterized protein METZ01_LOCUS160949, partial [marine metagenome]